MCIIHNLKTYTSRKQVKEYIENTLKKSATFELKDGDKKSSNIQIEDGTFYYEKNSDPKIFHLIFANEGSDVGNFYNNFTLSFIERSYHGVTDFTNFNVIQTIKERFVELSKEIIAKKMKIKNLKKKIS